MKSLWLTFLICASMILFSTSTISENEKVKISLTITNYEEYEGNTDWTSAEAYTWIKGNLTTPNIETTLGKVGDWKLVVNVDKINKEYILNPIYLSSLHWVREEQRPEKEVYYIYIGTAMFKDENLFRACNKITSFFLDTDALKRR